MNRFEIRCTESQTKKALELGAPITRQSPNSDAPFFAHGEERNEFRQIVPKLWSCPTAEEMAGWLEGQLNDMIVITPYEYIVSGVKKSKYWFNSRKEATLAAIDAALEYLSNNKK